MQEDDIEIAEKSMKSPRHVSLAANAEAHIRGLHLVDAATGWASGSQGTVLRMTDGQTWQVVSPMEQTHLDFRDVHGFDAQQAVIMAAGNEGRIFRTDDGGATWKQVFEDLTEGVFLDGMDFHDSLGICYGDPIGERFYGVFSLNYGKTWTKASMTGFPRPLDGEAGFAASGTGIIVMEDREYTATGGGPTARVVRSMREMESDMRTEAFDTPLRSGEGCGIFSMAFKNALRGVAVGGCYLDSTSVAGNCAYTSDAGRTWILSDSLPPAGYRSCVVYNEAQDAYITCGRTGVDISYDDGRSWQSITSEGYFTCATVEQTVWLMGRNGKCGRIDLHKSISP
ncbi:MAG: hypothetical protein HKN79_10265 [Flavobacteriales bacterium]|nr:hypothetical protein [Flavobacteriales bacterium]